VKQIVDLTGYDLVGATFDTVGTLMTKYQPPSGFEYDEDYTQFAFNFDSASDTVKNLKPGGFTLTKSGVAGVLVVGTETYSPENTYCRIWRTPQTASMQGLNNPQAISATLSSYTFQWWMNFDTSYYSVSTGRNVRVLMIRQVVPDDGGMEIWMEGVAGLHEWEFWVRHYDGASSEYYQIENFVIDSPPGWKLYTITFRLASSPPYQMQLYENGALVGQASNTFTLAPTQPPVDCSIQYGSGNFVGGMDQMRLLNTRLNLTEISNSYDQCTELGPEDEFEWKMKILVDGALYGERVIEEDEERNWVDFKVPIRHLVGAHEVAYRLQYEKIVPPIIVT